MIQIDMDMPNSCVDCHFRLSKTLEMIEGPKTTHMCTATLKMIDNINKKAEWCPLNEEAPQVHTEEPAKRPDPIAAAKVIKDYCDGCKSCSECVFNVDFNVDCLGCRVKGIHHMWGIANKFAEGEDD